MTKLETHLKKKRESLGITQSELAKLFNLASAQFISNCERGKCGYPVKHFNKLSKMLKMPVKTMISLRLEDEKQRMIRAIGVRGFGGARRVRGLDNGADV